MEPLTVAALAAFAYAAVRRARRVTALIWLGATVTAFVNHEWTAGLVALGVGAAFAAYAHLFDRRSRPRSTVNWN